MKRLAVLVATVAVLATSSPAGALPAYTKEPTSFTNPRLQGHPRIVGVRVSEHEAFDRIVIDVRGRRPNFRIQYVDTLSYDGSGEPVPLPGRGRIGLSLPQSQAHTDDGVNLFAGPRLKRYSLPTLRGVAITGDWEGVVSFGFTARNKKGYRIFELTNPTRVVIDLKH